MGLQIMSDAAVKKAVIAIKMGRPTVYRKDMDAELIILRSRGYTQAQICANFGISRMTLNRWRKEHPTFSEAYDIGDECFKAHEDELWQKAIRKEEDVNAALLDRYTRAHNDDYRDSEARSSQNIHVEKMEIQSLPPAQMQRMLEDLWKQRENLLEKINSKQVRTNDDESGD